MNSSWSTLAVLLRLAMAALLVCGASTWAQTSARPLQAQEAMRALGPAELALLRDPTGTLSDEQVRSGALAAQFQPLSGGLSLGYTQDVIWLRITVAREADAPAQWRLELTSALMDDVRLYSPEGGPTPQQAGDRYPFDERQLRYRRPVFELSLPTSDPQVYYLRLRSESALFAQLLLRAPRAFEAAQQVDAMLVGALLGTVLISLLFFLQAGMLQRDGLLLATAGVTGLYGLAAMTNLGLLSQYVLPRTPAWADALHPMSMALFFPSLCFLFGRALGVASPGSWLLRSQIPVAVLCVCAAVSRFFDAYVTVGGYLMMLGIMSCLGWITVAAWVVWRRDGRGLITASALTLCSASFAVAPFVAMGALPPFRFWELFWALGCIGFLLLAQISTLKEARQGRVLRLAAERSMRQAQRDAERELGWRKQQALYFAGVAHDLRTPLSALRVGVVNLRRWLRQDPDKAIAATVRLEASVLRAGELIERHLQLQQIEQPDFQLQLESVDLVLCLERIRSMAIDAWPDRQIQLNLAGDPPATVRLDEELMVRALVNLLGNAARASQAPSPLELSVAWQAEEGLRFEVRDQGPGLAPGLNLDELLRVHWRRSRTALQPRATTGFGIGLPMVGRIAALHGGRVGYRREGASTVLTIWLPCSSTMLRDTTISNPV